MNPWVDRAGLETLEGLAEGQVTNEVECRHGEPLSEINDTRPELEFSIQSIDEVTGVLLQNIFLRSKGLRRQRAQESRSETFVFFIDRIGTARCQCIVLGANSTSLHI